MKPREPRSHSNIGWIAAAIAVMAALVITVGIAEKQNARTEPHIKTEEAAKKAGAFVTPTDPKLAPNAPEGYRAD
jgi:hypothetical protein